MYPWTFFRTAVCVRCTRCCAGGRRSVLTVRWRMHFGPAAQAHYVCADERSGAFPLSRTVRTLRPEELARLAELLKNWRLPVEGPMGWEQAQVTGGGIALQEIGDDFQSRCRPGLYLAGEVLDVAGGVRRIQPALGLVLRYSGRPPGGWGGGIVNKEAKNGTAGQYALTVIARIHSDFKTKFGIPRQSGLIDALTAEVVFEPEFRNADALRGIEGFSHLWLIWQFSAAAGRPWSPTVRPPRLGGNTRMGVFATRSPFRPNALGLSCVWLLDVCRGTGAGVCCMWRELI